VKFDLRTFMNWAPGDVTWFQARNAEMRVLRNCLRVR